MNELDALRAAVVADPDDNTVRLAYADLLDETGGKANTCHAKYIRTTIRAAIDYGPEWYTVPVPAATNTVSWCYGRLCDHWQAFVKAPMPRHVPSADGTPSNITLYVGGQRDAVAKTHGVQFQMYDPTSKYPYAVEVARDQQMGRWLFRDGFVSELVCHWPFLVANGADLFENEPIRSVRLTRLPTTDELISECHRRVSNLSPGFAANVPPNLSYYLNALWPKIPDDRWLFGVQQKEE